eukprot:XP_015571384.1 uncharacterized protein LOC8281037 [Ricinus communis]
MDCVLAAIYALLSEADRNVLWLKLLEAIDILKNPWFLAGDFNGVHFSCERSTATVSFSGVQNFNNFIASVAFLDMPLTGRRFTWLTALKKGLSDRCPLVVEVYDTKWGLKAFRFMDSWLEQPGFDKMIDDWWLGFRNTNDGPSSIIRMLDLLREELRRWNKNSFGNIKQTIGRIEDQIDELDLSFEKAVPKQDVLRNRRLLWIDLWQKYKQDEIYWRQMSRSKWVKDGDQNTILSICLLQLGSKRIPSAC